MVKIKGLMICLLITLAIFISFNIADAFENTKSQESIKEKIRIIVNPFGEGYYSYSSIGRWFQSSLMNALVSTGRYDVYGVTFYNKEEADIIITGEIDDLDIQGIDHYSSGGVDINGRPVRRYSHTSFDADMRVEYSIISKNNARVIKRGHVISSDMTVLYNSINHHHRLHRHGHHRSDPYRFRFNMSYNSYHDDMSGMINNLIRSAASNSRYSVCQVVKDLFPLRGKIISKSDIDKDQAWIDLGSADGVNLNDRFVIFSDNQEIAILRINRVKNNMARGKLFTNRDHPNIMVIKGHRVISKGY